MLERFFGAKFHTYFHVFSLTVIAGGLAWGKAFMSIGFVLLIANFILEFKPKLAVQTIRKNKFSWIVIGFFLSYMIGLLWSIDFMSGVKDVKSRLPMLIIPLIIVARPMLTKKEIGLIFNVLIASLVITSLINVSLYYNLIGNIEHSDVRGMSHFGSHIRYAILIVLGMAICIFNYSRTKKHIILFAPIIGWFILYTVLSEVLTGLISLVALMISTIIYLLWKWKQWSAIGFSVIIFSCCFYGLLLMKNQKEINYDIASLPATTVNGNVYYHSNYLHSEMNGIPLNTFRCDKELEIEWNKKSKISFEGQDAKNHFLKNTLVRYMTALQVHKDSAGFQKLSSEDIQNIENGFVYPSEKNEHLLPRIRGVRYQLMNQDDPNGHSLLQRFEYWRISKIIIEKNPFFGVGTGGNALAFEREYAMNKTKLLKENQLRSHNMFLSYWISFGIFGVCAFVLMLFLLLRSSFNTNYLLGFQFISILAVSCLIEDSLETQMGVTIFGLFVGLILNQRKIFSNEEVF